MTEQENLRRLNEWRVKENLPTIALAQAATVGKTTTSVPTAISPGKTLPIHVANGDNTVDLAGDDVDDDDDAEEDEDEEDEEDDDGDVDSEDVEIDLNE